MPAAEFFIFAALMILTAVLSVSVRHMLYAVFFQVQTVVAVCGALAGLNANFSGFAILSMSLASLFVFLIFSLIIFDVHKKRVSVPKQAPGVSLFLFIALSAETAWVFLRPEWPGRPNPKDFSLPFLGEAMYGGYALCTLIFGVLLLCAMVGVTTLLVETEIEKEKTK